MRLSSMNVKSPGQEAQPQSAPENDNHAEAEPDPDRPPQTEVLEKAWADFMSANGDKKFLLGAMRRGLPRHLGACRYELETDNPAMRQDAEQHLPGLVEFLRHATGCASLSMAVTEKAPEQRPKHLSPAEHLKVLIENNPDAARLLDMIDAEQI